MRTLIEHFNMHDVIEPDASVVMLRSLYVYYLEEGNLRITCKVNVLCAIRYELH